MDQDAYKKHNQPEKGAQPGIYKFPGNNEELWAETFPAADAFVRQGWKYDRPLPSAEDRAKHEFGVADPVEQPKVDEKSEDKKGK